MKVKMINGPTPPGPEELPGSEITPDFLQPDIKQEMDEELDDLGNEMFPPGDDDTEMKMDPDGISSYHPGGGGTGVNDMEGVIKTEMDTDIPPTPKSKRRPPPPRKRKKLSFTKKKKTKAARSRSGCEVKAGQKCDICTSTVSFPDMFAHMESHVGDFALKCPNPKCSYAFSNPRTMHREHVRRKKACQAVANRLGHHVCETCGLREDNAVAFRAHLRLHETGIKNVDCPVHGCGERFTVRQSVYPHIFQKHVGAKTVQQCKLCLKYLDVQGMETHLKDQHDVTNPIKCRQCSFVFSDWEPLLDHLIKHRADGVPCYICTTGLKFGNISELRKHFFKEHGIGRLFICEQCGAECPDPNHLRVHIRMVHDGGRGKWTKTFSCDLCPPEDPHKFKQEASLFSHKIRCHGAEPFACSVCNATTFVSRAELDRHTRQTHGVEGGFKVKPTRTEFPCQVEGCSEIFLTRHARRKHKESSHGIFLPSWENLECDICSKVFHGPDSLKKHKDRIHLGIRKIVCECGEDFSSHHNLRRHKMIHSGDSPLGNETSPVHKAFRQKEVLDVHLRSHETLGDKFKPKGPRDGRKRIKRD